jgi:hypothetical protein
MGVREEARHHLVTACVSFAASRLWDESHPGDPHISDELDMKQEEIDRLAMILAWRT